MASFLSTGTLSVSDLRIAYRENTGTVSMSEMFRNGLYVASLGTTSSQIASVSGSVSVGNNISLSQFRGVQAPDWVASDILTLISSPSQYNTGDSAIVIPDLYSYNTSTVYLIKDSTVTSSISLIKNSGGTFDYTDYTGNLNAVWSSNSLGRVLSSAYNNNTGLVIVSEFTPSTYRYCYHTPSSTNILADWVLGSNLGYPTQLAPWGDYILAINWNTTLAPGGINRIRLRATSDGVNWDTDYWITVSEGLGVDIETHAGIAFITGTGGFLAYNTDPIHNPAGWVTLNSIKSVMDNATVRTVCYNRGVWVVGGHGGRIARATMTDFYADNFQAAASDLRVNYFFNSPNRNITRIVAYKTGFLAFGSRYRSTAWSSDGQNWYFGISSNSQLNFMGETRDITGAHYNTALDRVYIWCRGGYYARTQGNNELTFTSDGTSIPDTSFVPLTLDFLTVAGGGGGGGVYFIFTGGGGGGAGGYLTGSQYVTAPGSYTVVVGAGGAGGVSSQPNTTYTQGFRGNDSAFLSYTATGGGGGVSSIGTSGGDGNLSGGSGGGGSCQVADGSEVLPGTGIYAVTGDYSVYGNSGGRGIHPYRIYHYHAGGGGGAGEPGADAVYTQGAGRGGNGRTWIDGVTYAGGGGGGMMYGDSNTSPTFVQAQGGTGGGGAGYVDLPGADSMLPATSGQANTGGGGGGGPVDLVAPTDLGGGNGGSGIVIIAYNGPPRATGGTLVQSDGKTYHYFYSSGIFTLT